MNCRGATTMSGMALVVAVITFFMALGAILYSREGMDTKKEDVKTQHELAEAVKEFTQWVKTK